MGGASCRAINIRPLFIGPTFEVDTAEEIINIQDCIELLTLRLSQLTLWGELNCCNSGPASESDVISVVCKDSEGTVVISVVYDTSEGTVVISVVCKAS